jgi:regulatory protein
MSYCARGERCTEDVVTKLKTWEVPESLQRGIIETLYSENFLDDSRFAKSFANDKWRFNGWGKIRIS